MPKISDRRVAKGYANGQVFFGKWIANEGLVGELRVIDTPGMVVIPKLGFSTSALARGLSLVVRNLENDEKWGRIEQSDVLDCPVLPLDYVLDRMELLLAEVGVMRSMVLGRTAGKESDEVDTELGTLSVAPTTTDEETE